MHSKSCAQACLLPGGSCVKNLTVTRLKLCFLLNGVYLKNYLTQFVGKKYTAWAAVLTSLPGGLYPQSTAVTTITINFNNLIIVLMEEGK